MKLLPLEQFKCDACGQIIGSPDAGWVEWLAGPTRGTKAHGFRIVHNNNRCQYPSSTRVHDMSLSRLLGPDGLALLLALVAPGGRTGNREDGVESLEEWCELVRRLQIPYFEEARQYWSDAEADDYFTASDIRAPYSQAMLTAVLRRYGHDVAGSNGENAKATGEGFKDETGSVGDDRNSGER
ncbi:MAG TPA: hypothetical protein VF792_11655 [Ktedonobacterales bacterium]